MCEISTATRASSSTTRTWAGPLLTLPLAPYLGFACKAGPLLPMMLASGHRMLHSSPEGKKWRLTLASRLYSTMLQMTDEPNPECDGPVTGGPPLSRQSRVNWPQDENPSFLSQKSSTRPV